jgi:tetratricopeptide (TPR) repeat protein
MRPRSLAFLLAILATVPATAQHDHGQGYLERPAALLEGMGKVHHPVSTRVPEAQKFFDQGLALLYGFNHDEAWRSFRRAAELDPGMAMAWWGMALVLGPNYNLPPIPDREKMAYEAIQQAQKLAPKVSENERAYITALANRYDAEPSAERSAQAAAYKEAMCAVMRRFPDDLNAATLCAEAAMNLRPWALWAQDGTPAEGTEEILEILEGVLRRDPGHIGANHYYIHATEASRKPELALASACRLGDLAPAAGHLVHMPAHVWIRTGDFEKAAVSNERAAAADRAFLEATGAQGVYPMMYYTHNLHFLSAAEAFRGRYEEAMESARQMEENLAPHVKEMPSLDVMLPQPMAVLVRFRQWDKVLAEPQPPAEQPMSSAMWHFGRGLAYAARGDLQRARAERKALQKVRERTPEDAMGMVNKLTDLQDVAAQVLDGSIARAAGDLNRAILHFDSAVEIEDRLNYMEPPEWFYPVRESLGGTLLLAKRYADAERVFRAGLETWPRNGRLLFGLLEALKAQHKDYQARHVEHEFRQAWKDAKVELRVDDL